MAVETQSVDQDRLMVRATEAGVGTMVPQEMRVGHDN